MVIKYKGGYIVKSDKEIISKDRFETLKKAYEGKGYRVITRWRKGLKAIRLADIRLTNVFEEYLGG